MIDREKTSGRNFSFYFTILTRQKTKRSLGYAKSKKKIQNHTYDDTTIKLFTCKSPLHLLNIFKRKFYVRTA